MNRPTPARSRGVEPGAAEHYADPAYYTKAYRGRRHDVAYYVALARRVGERVLELGVGNGRVALPIAQAGVEVVGVDTSRPMLADLARRAARLGAVGDRVRVVRGDMRRVRLGERFALVIAPFNTVLHLYTRADAEAFFATVQEHLAPGGQLVFDFSVPVPSDLAADPDESRGGPRLRHPTTGELVRYRERFDYDAVRQVLRVDMEFHPVGGQPGWEAVLTHRQFFPQEMEALLAYAGFREVGFTGDFTDLPATATTDSLVVTARVGPRLRRAARAGLAHGSAHA